MPGYVPGLATVISPASIPDAELQEIKDALRSPSNGRFFSMFPASTPKYARNRGPRSSERTDSMARFFIRGRGPQLDDENLAASVGNLFTGGVRYGQNTQRSGGEGGEQGFGFFDFLLGSTNINYQEREQAVDTISDNTVIFYSGMTAPVLQGSGALLNTFQDDQNVWFQYAYMECLRGSRLAAKRQIASLVVDSFRYEGYLSTLTVQTTAQIQNAVMFNFTMRVKRITVVTPVLYRSEAAAEVWSRQQDPLVSTAPVTVDDTTPTGVEAAVNPVAARALPSAVASATAAMVDPRAVQEGATTPPSLALAESANQIAVETTIMELAAQADAMFASAESVLIANNALSASGDVVPQVLPPDTIPSTVPTVAQQRALEVSGAVRSPFSAYVPVQRDASSGVFVVPQANSTVTGSAAAVVSAGTSADRVAAAAQVGALAGPVYGQSQVAAPSTLPAYAQASQLPGGFTDIYRVQGTVFAEAYARAASQVAVARTVVGRRSRRRTGASAAHT